MEITASYSVKICHYNSILKPTVAIYRAAVEFFVRVCSDEWEKLSQISGANRQMREVERLTHRTQNNPMPRYCFDDTRLSKRALSLPGMPETAESDGSMAVFYKFPSYLRRSAIHAALGMVSSWKSRLSAWEEEDPKARGRRPSLPKTTAAVMPVLYHGNCYERTGTYTAKIKVFVNNTWDWLGIGLRRSDVNYIERNFADRKASSPSLRRKGKEWFLSFAYTQKRTLPDVPLNECRILAADLGINHACTCVCMTKEGAVLGREFLSLPREEDSLTHAIGRIKKAQMHGARRMPRLWAKAKGITADIASKTAAFIIEKAIAYGVHVIVFEHLDVRGKKKGSRRQRLHHWRAAEVGRIVTDRAHRNGMRISHVCAWGTSSLAYDGSGRVERGKEAGLPSYSVCRFTTGKIYDCDLNASYNIGARYFVREITKSVPETERLQLGAKVPGACKRSTCTLSTLINLNAEMRAKTFLFLSLGCMVERYFPLPKAASGRMAAYGKHVTSVM